MAHCISEHCFLTVSSFALSFSVVTTMPFDKPLGPTFLLSIIKCQLPSLVPVMSNTQRQLLSLTQTKAAAMDFIFPQWFTMSSSNKLIS